MSDDWITLIPENPRFIPDADRRLRARDRFAEIALEADEVEVRVCDVIEFFDCGANFERIRCRSCRSEVSIEWWQDRMDDDRMDGFKLAEYASPCCEARATLNDLDYEWPQGFAQFALDAMNPSIGKLDDELKSELEAILGTTLKGIYRHI